MLENEAATKECLLINAVGLSNLMNIDAGVNHCNVALNHFEMISVGTFWLKNCFKSFTSTGTWKRTMPVGEENENEEGEE